MQEKFHVTLPDTVVDPRAMVVHFKNAETTLTAVMSSHRLPRLFAQALLTILHLHVLALKRRSHALGDATRVCKSCTDVADIGHQTEAVESEAPE